MILFIVKNNNYIFDLNKTVDRIIIAYNEIKKKIMVKFFLLTQKQAKEDVVENTLRSGSFYCKSLAR